MINQRAPKQSYFRMDLPVPVTTEIRHILSETSNAKRWAEEHVITIMRSFYALCGVLAYRAAVCSSRGYARALYN